MLHFLLLSVKRFLGNAKKVGQLLGGYDIFIAGEVVLEGHEMRGLLEAEAQLFRDQQEIIVIDFLVFALFLQSFEELRLDSLILDVLDEEGSTLLSVIHTSRLAIIIIILSFYHCNKIFTKPKQTQLFRQPSYYAWLNYYLTSMFANLIRRAIFPKCYSLKNPTYALPEEINWLQTKFSTEPRYADRFLHLQQLQKMNILPSFYEDKPLDALSEADIFFLMNSNTSYNLNRRGQMQLIVKVYSTYFKCLLYKEFGLAGQVEQQIIILSFNEQVFDMKPEEIAFCLGVIYGFDKQKQLDLHRLEKTLERYTSHHKYQYQMLIIHGSLAEMGITLKRLLTVKLFQEWVEGNTKWDLKAIYFVFLLSETLKIEVDSSLKSKLDQNLKKAITNFKFNQFETNYLVFLLKYYPEQAHKLNIVHFTPKAYIGYLNYFKLNPEVTLKDHKIPNSVLELSSFDAFKDIIELRVHLKLDTPNSIARSISDYFVYSLSPVGVFLSYLRENKISDVEIEYFLQKVIKSKLHLEEFDPEKLEEYSIEETISLLTKLSKMHLCPVDFWRSTVRWIQSLLHYNKHKAVVIQPNNTNYINLLHLVVTKNFKQETREIIYGKITELLQRIDHPWQLQQLFRLTKTLSLSKIGQQKLWLLIEHRVSQLIQKKAPGQIPSGIQQIICRIAQQFGFIGQGSYNFWTTINDKLSNRAKREILDKIKSPSSQAHLYLKISSDS